MGIKGFYISTIRKYSGIVKKIMFTVFSDDVIFYTIFRKDKVTFESGHINIVLFIYILFAI